MKIGTDMSLAVCKREGYLIMEYVGKGPDKLMVKGELQKEVYCNFLQYEPDYCLEEQGYTVLENGTCMAQPGEGSYRVKSGKFRGLQAMQFCSRPLMMDESHSAQDIWELYLRDKLSIDNYTGSEGQEFPTTPHELLHLASDVSSYSNIMHTS